MGRLSGKVAIISGGARGMGASHAEVFVGEGAMVVVADVREQEGTALAARLGELCRFHRLDVTSAANWAEVVAATETTFGKVNVLVNNAAIAEQALIEHAEDDHYERTIAVNQTGVFYGMRAVIPAMRRAGRGSIINISSIATITANAKGGVYAASKGAIAALSRVAAVELAADDIRVNTIHPGIINTPMLGNVDFIHAVLPMIPMRRLGEPREISMLALFLASDESSFSTGSQFVADGGYTAV